MLARDPTQRFSDRVENYLRYRPGYPAAVYDYLQAEAGLQAGAEVADLGSGTGLLSRLFLARGHHVFAVEPNGEMRAAAERLFTKDENFVSLAGRAEVIPLAAGSVDFVASGQAFHWFEPQATRREVRRILRRGGQAALIWNTRDLRGSEFQRAYEDLLLQFGTDFRQVDHSRNLSDEKIGEFFSPKTMRHTAFPNAQQFDFEGLRGRLLSSSYAPVPGEPNYDSMLAALKSLFTEFQKDGVIRFTYQTIVYHGKMD
jgi:SAM-dependent methyltransferase